jgi:hypothetical protein
MSGAHPENSAYERTLRSDLGAVRMYEANPFKYHWGKVAFVARKDFR